MKQITFLSQNVRGVKTDARIVELCHVMKKRNAIAACLQETWRKGQEVLDFEQYRLISSGLNEATCRRGSQGVAICLNPDGVDAWNAAGLETHSDLGPRVLAIRLLLRDKHNRDVGVFLVSAYAPVGNAPEHTWNEFLIYLTTCLNRKRNDDILVIGCDCNSSMGVNRSKESGPLGNFGISHVNDSGKRMLSYLAIQELKVVTTCFKKKKYGTWMHPRSKNLHQIDHIFVNREMFVRCIDAGITSPLLDSDHNATFVTLRLMKRLKKKNDNRQRLLALDHSHLLDPDVKRKFFDKIKNYFDTNAACKYSELSKSMSKAATDVLPRRAKAQPDWFKFDEKNLNALIDARNEAMRRVFNKRTRFSEERLRLLRTKVKVAVRSAKNKWLHYISHATNVTVGTKTAWDNVKLLKKGLSKVKPVTQKQLKKPDGTLCKTPDENATVFKDHFQKLYENQVNFDETVLDLLSQRPVFENCDEIPSDEEIRTAISKLKNKAPGESGVMTQSWKIIIDSQEIFQILKSIITDFWVTETVPKEWNIGRLNVLPKKGDLSLPKNYRGIMLLENAYKIIAIILHRRLLPIEESLDHESQSGFRPGRGCMDAVFTVKTAIKKRREHGLETWILFLDLVKAFDRVPRIALWKVLEKYGVPLKLINLLIVLHADFTVKFVIGDVVRTINSIVGVKQGDILGPLLFTFYITAMIETWKLSCGIPFCIFRSKSDFVMTGRRTTTKGEDFELPDSEYADDTALLFESRDHIQQGATSIIVHFDRFGMEIHTGAINPKSDSKTEILFCAKPIFMYDNPETLDNVDLSDVIIDEKRYLPIVDEFCYLGSIVTNDCTDEKDVDTRIAKASGAFGMLRKCLFASSDITNKAKGSIFRSLILPILLYGSECWCMTESLLRKIRSFYHGCIRSMCRVNRKHTFLHRISTDELLERVGLESIETYIYRQQLRWIGHVSRMDWDRLPRKMLSSWVVSKRPRGCPKMTYGRSIRKCMSKCGINVDNWFVMAGNRLEWNAMIRNLSI